MSARELLLNAKIYIRRHLAGHLVINYADIYTLAVHIIDHIPLHVEQSANVRGTLVVHVIDAVLQHEEQSYKLREWVKTDFYIEILKAYETYYKKMAEKSSCWMRFYDLFCCKRRETVLRPVFSEVLVKEPAALQHEPAASQHEFVDVDFLGKEDKAAYPRGIPIV